MALQVDLFGAPADPAQGSVLARRWQYPPLSVLNTREDWWQERKRQWLALGIRSELGREGAFAHGANYNITSRLQSVFDPVICELALRWWAPPSGLVLDPFAGGSVRGIVAGILGRRYYGIDLRPEQCAANREQAAAICPQAPIVWACGDSAELLPAWQGAADFILTCPPYGSLERYSDDPRDLSAMPQAAFEAAYAGIIAAAAAKLRPNRFACIVVGDYLCGRALVDLGGMTVRAAQAAGLVYHSKAIIVNPAGSAGFRANRVFCGVRRLTRTHQEMLVFCKGDPKAAARACDAAA